ncbi:MAG TPA: hypothetical protein PL162_08465 [Synergistaceae bacterium]|nr:hypothetical protein [Synergistaceae bacterium]
MTRPPELSSDLSTDNTLQEGLRALFLLGADGIQLKGEDGSRIVLAKEHLIVLLERGLGDETLGALARHPEWCRPYRESRGALSPEMRIIQLEPEGRPEGDALTELEKFHGDGEEVPCWWSIPLPLLAQRKDRVMLNRHGQGLFPEASPTLGDVHRALARDHLMSWPDQEGKSAKTFLLVPLTEEVFLLEDVSSDMALAEDVAWWAAVGKALLAYNEARGYRIRLWRGVASPPEFLSNEEAISCQWEGQFLGSLVLEPPSKPVRRRTPKPSPPPSEAQEESPSSAAPSKKKGSTPSKEKKGTSSKGAEEGPLEDGRRG